jgi:hypothetical protein
MSDKIYKDLSNSELQIEKRKLEDKYEVIKIEIKTKYEELEKLDREYNKIENEIKLRKNIML